MSMCGTILACAVTSMDKIDGGVYIIPCPRIHYWRCQLRQVGRGHSGPPTWEQLGYFGSMRHTQSWGKQKSCRWSPMADDPLHLQIPGCWQAPTKSRQHRHDWSPVIQSMNVMTNVKMCEAQLSSMHNLNSSSCLCTRVNNNSKQKSCLLKIVVFAGGEAKFDLRSRGLCSVPSRCLNFT